MKKFLIASTALVATAGVAAAEVTLSGAARFGLAYTEGATDETRIEQRFRLNIRGTAVSDNGVEFSTRVRLETNEAADSSISGRGPGAAEFSVETGGFRLDVGNTSDVLDSGDVGSYYGAGVGLTFFLEQNSAFYDGGGLPVGGFGAGNNDQTTIKLRYTTGDLTAAVSYSDNNVAGTEEMQVGVGYNFGNYSVGGVYGNEDGGVEDFYALMFSGDLGAFGFSAVVGDSDTFTDVAYGFTLTYDVGAATTIKFVYSDGGSEIAGVDDDAAYGIGFNHSLGGGVSLRGGVGQSTAGVTLADLGVNFSF